MDTDRDERGEHSIDGGEDERQFAYPHLLLVLATPHHSPSALSNTWFWF